VNIAYSNKEYNKALPALQKLPAKIPDGKYAIDANIPGGRYYNGRKDFNNALKYYDAVAAKAPNKICRSECITGGTYQLF
jgi:tetratricopeptide (TPR) repeat protein